MSTTAETRRLGGGGGGEEEEEEEPERGKLYVKGQKSASFVPR